VFCKLLLSRATVCASGALAIASAAIEVANIVGSAEPNAKTCSCLRRKLLLRYKEEYKRKIELRKEKRLRDKKRKKEKHAKKRRNSRDNLSLYLY